MNFDCHCSGRCPDIFPKELSKRAFESFWQLGDYSKQNTFLRGLVKVNKAIRSCRCDFSGIANSYTYQYTLQANKNITVCKKCFLGTLQVSWGQVYHCISEDEVLSVTDHRGKHIPSNNIRL
jgi:hypothetical protein